MPKKRREYFKFNGTDVERGGIKRMTKMDENIEVEWQRKIKLMNGNEHNKTELELMAVKLNFIIA